MKQYSSLASAKRALKAISVESLKHAKELIKETADGKFSFDIDEAEFYLPEEKEVWDEPMDEVKDDRTQEERDAVFALFNSPKPVAPVEEDKPFGFADHGFYCCPNCNIHLDNGVGYHLQEVNGKYIKHEKFEFECMACGTEFGPAIAPKKAKAVATSTREIKAPSTAVKPYVLAKQIVASMDGQSRKDIIAACMAQGITYNTADNAHYQLCVCKK